MTNVEIYQSNTSVQNADTRGLKMSIAGVRYKIMPENLDVDLAVLKDKVETVVETFDHGKLSESIEDPIAFGLKALVITISLAESEETESVEAKLLEIEGVSSVELTDYRRAVG